MSLFMPQVQTFTGFERIHIDGDTVNFRDEVGYIVETSPNYICLKFPGRSVYSNVYGTVYHPARYFFGHIAGIGDGYFEIDEGLYVPIRS